MLNNLQTFFSQFSTSEIALVGIAGIFLIAIIYMFFKIKKLSFNYYAKSVSQTVESQTQQIVKLEKELSLFKREDTGVLAKWAPPREDKAAYLLTIYNDTPETIHNISVEIEERYRSVCKIFFEKSQCDPQKQVLVFFIPGGYSKETDLMTSRNGFVTSWMKNKLEPIKFVVKYSKTPIAGDFQEMELLFNRTNLTKHLANKIRTIHKKLTILPTPKPD